MAAFQRSHDSFVARSSDAARDGLSDEKQQALLDQALAGSNEAHGLLLETCRPWMHAIFNRGLPDGRRRQNDVDDLTQEACLRAHMGLAKFIGLRIGSYCAWLKKICLNLLATALRQAPREETVNEEFLEHELRHGYGRRQPTPEEVLATLHRRDALADALNGLEHDERQIVFWRYFDELSLDDIGERYGWSRQVVALVLKRAFALQDVLAQLAAA